MVVAFVANKVAVELVAIGAALALWATGVLDLEEAISGFGDPTVLFIASLFVVSEGLDATGTTTWAGQKVIALAGDDRRRLTVLVLLLVAVLTAVITVNGAVAALLPMVVIVAIRTGLAPSRILMPLAFAAHAGSQLALTGTPVNVLVSEAAADAGVGGFGFFDFAVAGVPLVAGTIAIVVLVGDRLLPERTPRSLPADLSAHARTLGRQYLADHRVFRLAVPAGSPVIGSPGIGHTEDDVPDELELIGIQVHGEGPLTRPVEVRAGDVLIVRGEPGVVRDLAARAGLDFEDRPFTLDGEGDVLDRELGVAEVVVPPRSGLVGQQVFPGMVTDSGDLVILAVQRRGEDLGATETTLAVGDVLLVQGRWEAIDAHVPTDPEVLVVDAPDQVRRQAVPLGPRSKEALAILGLMVVALATGIVPAVVATLVAAAAMVLLRVLTIDQAYRGVSWTTVVLVGAMISLSTAMTKTGAAEQIAGQLVDVVGDSDPRVLLLGLFLLTAVLGQLISNTATALIIIPIAVSAATELAISPKPVLMSVAVAAAAALFTPVATPANLMVMGPGGYRFGDYWKLGLPLMIWFFIVATFYIPLVWRF